MWWLVVFVVAGGLAVYRYANRRRQQFQGEERIPSTSANTTDRAWLKFEFESAPLSRIVDTYTRYTANRFKEHCEVQLEPYKDVVLESGGLITVNMKRGLRDVELRLSGLPDDLGVTICDIVRHVQPPLEEGELAYRAMERRNARQRYMRSLGRWKS